LKRFLLLAVPILGMALLTTNSFAQITGPATIDIGKSATYTEARESVNGFKWTAEPSATLTPSGNTAAFKADKLGSFDLKCDGDEMQNYGWRGRRQRLVPWSDTLSIAVTGKPVPPPPLPPQVGLRFLITGDIRQVRDMSFDGVAVLTSRTVRDWMDKACEPGGFLIAPLSVAQGDPKFAPLAAKASKDRVTAVALVPKKEPLVIDPVPAFDVLIAKVSEYAGVKVGHNAARAPPTLREFSAEEWKKYIGQNGVATVNGKQRFLASKSRDLKKHPYGAAPGTVPLADAGVRVIPRTEWKPRLDALKRANAGIRALLWDVHPCHDQASTNYCWANGPTTCGDSIIYLTGRGNYLLSAASVGCPVTGFSNEGGWPADAVAYMAKKGAVRDSLWPNATISRSYWNRADVQADYQNHLVTQTIADLGASGSIFEETVTCVLLGCPVATSHNWWSHAVTATGLDYSDGVWYLEERNSWGMDYGQQGFFKLREGGGRNQAGPDDGQSILWIGAKAKLGGDGASLKPLTKITIDVPVTAEVACPSGNCGRGGRVHIFGR